MSKLKILFLVFLIMASVSARKAQESIGNYQIRVAPDRDDWTYELNQPVKFNVSVTLNNRQVSGLPINYSCGLEAMPPRMERTATTSEQSLTIEAGSLS